MGYAKTNAKVLDLNGVAICNEMMEADYEHAVQTFEKHFGEYINLIR